jgi:hypothetical protein
VYSGASTPPAAPRPVMSQVMAAVAL